MQPLRFAAGEHADHRRRHRGGFAHRDRFVESRQSLDHGAPFGELLIDRDEHRQRALDGVERGGGLGEHAELNVPGEIRRAYDDVREHDRSLVVAGGQERQPLGPRHDQVPIIHHRAEPVHEPGLLGALPAQQRDLLGILARAH